MAVYKRVYSGYSGAVTPAWSHFAIVTKFSYARLLQWKLLLFLLAACWFYPIGCLTFIYISHNPDFLAAMRIPPGFLPAVDGRFFYNFSTFQGTLAYLLAALVGPSLMSWDLANGALPLYFSRPLSRSQFVLGKMCVLLSLLSIATWIPALTIFGVEATLSGWTWTADHLWLAWAILAGLVVWITLISLIGLALAAWVKWRLAAGVLLLGVFFAGAGFGRAINSVLRTNTGSLINLTEVMHAIWADLLRYDASIDISVPSAWIAVALAAAICLWLLAKRIRAFEVVR